MPIVYSQAPVSRAIKKGKPDDRCYSICGASCRRTRLGLLKDSKRRSQDVLTPPLLLSGLPQNCIGRHVDTDNPRTPRYTEAVSIGASSCQTPADAPDDSQRGRRVLFIGRCTPRNGQLARAHLAAS